MVSSARQRPAVVQGDNSAGFKPRRPQPPVGLQPDVRVFSIDENEVERLATDVIELAGCLGAGHFQKTNVTVGFTADFPAGNQALPGKSESRQWERINRE